MQIALVDGRRTPPSPNQRGICPQCGSEMIAKCGPRIVHHWAHHRDRNCDPWWENETEWHRDWKNLFPVECREISHTAEDGEVHRADIKTPTGIIVEVQHSAISDNERQAREDFYGNLVWVVDGSTFNKNFRICHRLPDPDSPVAEDLDWFKSQWGEHGTTAGMFLRRSEANDERQGDYHFIQEVQDQVDEHYRGHHQYTWVRPRKTWLDAACPVYLDFGDHLLARLQQYDDSGLQCVRLVTKRKFVHEVMAETEVRAVASRFYPMKVG